LADSAGTSVRFESVCVRYERSDRNAVNGVTLEIPAGALAVFLGPSGSGKSTLLRTVNRLVPLGAGTIFLGDHSIFEEDVVQLRRRIGYAIQAVGLFPHMTVAQNIAIVPQLLGWSRSRIDARIDELLGLVRLEPGRYRDRLPRALSGGEAQRVGVARALAAQPPLLLMDEPFGAVDPIVRLALGEELLRIHRALGTTILFVTHDVDEALRLAGRIVVLRDGAVEQDDTPLHMLAHPATPYVEDILGGRDVIRRLGLLQARDALPVARAQTLPAATRIEAGRTLRDALSELLRGSDALAVYDGDIELGTLTFADIRRAISASAA
jgi:osmoprotectant transport system ATP-binding protein